MRRTMTVTEARASWGALLDGVAAGDEVTITRHGRSIAVVVRPRTLRAGRAEGAYAAAVTLRERIDAATGLPLSELPGIDADRAEELIAEIRAGRDAR